MRSPNHPPTPEPHLTGTILLVRPAAFGFNSETASTNAFQAAPGADASHTAAEIAVRAQAEFDTFAEQLRAAGLRVIVFQDPGIPSTPDSLFPNNWVSFHPGGQAVLYPMYAPNRRAERRTAVFDLLNAHGLPYPKVLDLSAAGETSGAFLEGTGSLVLDRARRIAYAAVSPRTHPATARIWADQLGYELFLFTAVDAAGAPIYHTNVLLSVGETVAIACFDALPDASERAQLAERLAVGGPFVLGINHAQLQAFAGNMLQVRPISRAPLLVMSTRAWASLAPVQQAALQTGTEILTVLLETIERYGGGSARCMVAEVF